MVQDELHCGLARYLDEKPRLHQLALTSIQLITRSITLHLLYHNWQTNTDTSTFPSGFTLCLYHELKIDYYPLSMLTWLFGVHKFLLTINFSLGNSVIKTRVLVDTTSKIIVMDWYFNNSINYFERDWIGKFFKFQNSYLIMILPLFKKNQNLHFFKDFTN